MRKLPWYVVATDSSPVGITDADRDRLGQATSPLAVCPFGMEMFQKNPAGAPHAMFPPRRTTAPRPDSDATEIFDTEFEEDFDDDDDDDDDEPPRNSPRASVNSVSSDSAIATTHGQY